MVTQCRRHHRQYPSILEDIRTSLEQLQCSRCITVAGSEAVLHWVALHIYIYRSRLPTTPESTYLLLIVEAYTDTSVEKNALYF